MTAARRAPTRMRGRVERGCFQQAGPTRAGGESRQAIVPAVVRPFRTPLGALMLEGEHGLRRGR
jgi:hypothetical protein